MPDNHSLDHLFPRLTDIPDAWRPDAPVEQREYLVNGELRRWDGPLAPVRSPIFLATDQGDEQVILGSTPLLDADADPDGDTFDTISEDELLRGIESLAPPERRDD